MFPVLKKLLCPSNLSVRDAANVLPLKDCSSVSLTGFLKHCLLSLESPVMSMISALSHTESLYPTKFSVFVSGMFTPLVEGLGDSLPAAGGLETVAVGLLFGLKIGDAKAG